MVLFLVETKDNNTHIRRVFYNFVNNFAIFEKKKIVLQMLWTHLMCYVNNVEYHKGASAFSQLIFSLNPYKKINRFT